MQVYEKRPSGLGAKELRAQADRDRRGAMFAAARAVAGIVLVGLIGAPLGPLWALIGIACLASVFVFVRAAGAAAIVRPALILTGTPKWDGTRRTSWSIEADDLIDAVRRLADGLDAELGESLTAFDEGAEYRGVTRRAAFDEPIHPVMLAWGVGGKARLKATEEVDGVWIRLESRVSGPSTATVLANPGRAVDTLKQVAWRV